MLIACLAAARVTARAVAERGSGMTCKDCRFHRGGAKEGECFLNRAQYYNVKDYCEHLQNGTHKEA